MSELETDESSAQSLIRPVIRSTVRPSQGAASGRLRRWSIGLAAAVLVALTAGAFVFLPRLATVPVASQAASSTAAPSAPLVQPGSTASPPPRLTEADYLQQAQAMVEADREKEAAERRAAEQQEKEERLARAKAEAQKAAALAAEQARKAAEQARLALLEKHRKIADYRKRAEGLERTERWADALADYEAALQLDPTLEFALAGRARVEPRAVLARRFDELIGHPERLFSESVRKQAHGLVEEGRKFSTASSPVLQGQIQELTALLAQAETPLRVALESDGATEVIINRVGRLGAFSRRELELLPGRYTVVGTRPGYRDVRRELAVLPGQAPPALIVRCEESI